MARGDGFFIFRHDVDALKSYFSDKGFETTEEEYLVAFIKIRLFVEEAKSVGLIEKIPEESGPYQYKKVQALYRIYLDYVRYLLENYPVDDQVILSYYLSYPERFPIRSPEKKDPHTLTTSGPDEKQRKDIHDVIVQSKQTVLIDEEFQRLKKKYHVVMGSRR